MPDDVNPKLSRELLGLAGEYAVASELCRRKLYAQLTMGNHKQTDILVETETAMVRIQVKAKQSTEWPAISGLYRAEDFLILVDFAKKSLSERPDFYVLNLKNWKALVLEEQGYKPLISVDAKNRIAYPDGWRGLNLKPARVMHFKEDWTKLHVYLKSETMSPTQRIIDLIHQCRDHMRARKLRLYGRSARAALWLALLFLYGCAGSPIATATIRSAIPRPITPTVSEPRACMLPETMVQPTIEANGDRLIRFTSNTTTIPLIYSPDGRWLAVATDRGVLLSDGQTLAPKLLCLFPGGVYSLAFTPDGQMLTAGGLSGTMATWHLPRGDLAAVARLPFPVLYMLAYSPDGTTFAVSGAGSVALFRTGETVPRWTTTEPCCALSGPVFMPDGRTIVVAGSGAREPHETVTSETRWLDVSDGHITRKRVGTVGSLVALSADMRQLALWRGTDAGLVLDSLDDAATPQRLFAPVGDVTALAFVADGAFLAVGDAGGTITLYDTRSGRSLPRIIVHTSRVTTIAASPDGLLLASASSDRTMRITSIARWR